MPPRRQPTARQIRLGTELRKLREAAGLTAREAAALLGSNSVQMSQTESGIAGVSEDRVRRIAAHYACTDEELVSALVAMATDRTRGWWEEYRGLLHPSFLDLSELEYHSTYRRDLNFLHIPGLLQTDGYARALFSQRVPVASPDDAELRVRHRMQRKSVITGPDPVAYHAVIHEAALLIRVSDRAAWLLQLAQILELSDAGNVTVRVIPFDLDDSPGALQSMSYSGGAVPKLDTVITDTPTGTGWLDSEAHLNGFRAHLRKAEDASLNPEKSRDFIHRMTKEP